ncbi:MAG TPA: hypothetical protein VK427_16820, partial [Kofleriaceae bacterium]|nr:hypothetical protein [Kofleriaceae bacterium]
EISAAIDDGDTVDRSGPSTGGPSPLPQRNDSDFEKLIAPLKSELRSLRALVRASGDNRGSNELHKELAALRQLVERLPAQTTPRAAAPATARTNRGAALVAPSAGRRVVFVGPTGVGKTTTIAKLAARAALIEQRSVQLVTLDNYRVGGIDQIRAFAELIGVPMHTAEHTADLADILVDENELVLIDTAGHSPRDAGAIGDLARQLADIGGLEVHLCVPATSSPAVLDDLATRYAPLRPTRLLFTKLDEVECTPELTAAPARLGLPVTWVTTGQRVPEDLEEPTLSRLVELSSTGLHAPAATNLRTRTA